MIQAFFFTPKRDHIKAQTNEKNLDYMNGVLKIKRIKNVHIKYIFLYFFAYNLKRDLHG